MPRRPLPLILVLLAACGGSSKPQAIDAPKNQWTWVDFPDSHCGNGTSTGIAINPGDGPDLVIFLFAGGACWSRDTCSSSDYVTTSSFGELAFLFLEQSQFSAQTFFDRALPGNPFASYSMVFVPYCTGDIHGGENTVDYGGGLTWWHWGHANFDLFMERVAATFPSPGRVVLAGSSAGGFGTMLNYPTVRAHWPNAQSYLIDDSGPALKGDAIPKDIRDAWYAQWRLDQVLDPFCPDCRSDLSAGYTALAAGFPQDRMSLVSFVKDTTIPFFFRDEATFSSDLNTLTTSVLAPLTNFRTFLVGDASPGGISGHVLFLDPSGVSSGGTTLTEWLGQQVTDAPGWSSEPPVPLP